MAVVVLPTPPFWFEMAMIRPIFGGMYHRAGELFHVEQLAYRPQNQPSLASGIGLQPRKRLSGGSNSEFFLNRLSE